MFQKLPILVVILIISYTALASQPLMLEAK